MPYIKQSDRDELQLEIAGLMCKVLAVAEENPDRTLDGTMNYVISTMVNVIYGFEPNYAKLNRAMGMLSCVQQEFYRRVVAPYEDIKIEENGDVFDAED